MTNLRVAVDIGGTFTDICILDEDSGALRVAKTASTPDDPLSTLWSDNVRVAITRSPTP